MYQTMLNRARKAGDAGFTLIELLIVIVVLGILAGIVVFGVGTFRSDATLAACKADKKTVEVAAEAFNAKTGAPPTGMTDLTGGTSPYLKSAPLAASGISVSSTGVVSSSVTGC